jgi:hypothetical protein
MQGETLRHVLSAIIRRCWIAQYARPMPLPTIVDAHSGDSDGDRTRAGAGLAEKL